MSDPLIPDGEIVTRADGIVRHFWTKDCVECHGRGGFVRLYDGSWEQTCDGCEGQGRPFVEDCPCAPCGEAWRRWEAEHPVPYVIEARP